jgi:hypothetical protein
MATTRRPMVGWGIGLLIGGVVLALVAAVGGYRAVANDLRFFATSSVSSPASIVMHLHPGRYYVMEKVGDTAGFGSLTNGGQGPSPISPSDVTVDSMSGGSVPVTASDTSLEFSRSTSRYRAAVQFQIIDDGTYTITVATPSARFLVVPEIGEVVRRALPWLFLLTMAGVLAVVGLVLLIAGLVRGRRAVTAPAAAMPATTMPATATPATAMPTVPAASAPAASAPAATPAAAPAGWYADPAGSGRWRWWDGQRWTDHLS